MSGVIAVRYKLVNDPALTTLIPAARISFSAIPEGTLTPCIAITSVSLTERRTVSMAETIRFIGERVQVTVYSESYRLQKQYMTAIRAACTSAGGNINGIKYDSVVPAGDGPDFFDDVLMVYEQSQDFIVRYSR